VVKLLYNSTERSSEHDKMHGARRNHGGVFKAKVALEAIKGEQTLAEIVLSGPSNQITQWKKQLEIQVV